MCFGISRRLKRYLFLLGIKQSCSHQHPLPIPVIISGRKRKRQSRKTSRPLRVLRPLPRAERHKQRSTCASHNDNNLKFGLLNVRSLHHKTDDIFELLADNAIDIFLLAETWHDSDSVCINRMRMKGLNVTERSRPRVRSDTVSTNHGGIAVVSRSDITHSSLSLKSDITSFEALSVKLTLASSSLIVLLIYRTGAVTTLFFEELSRVLEVLATETSPILLAGDLNIHVERPNDPHAISLRNLTASFGFINEVNCPTHNLGGSLDVVFRCSNLPTFSVGACDPGLSDHFLLTWSLSFSRPSPYYKTAMFRPWNRLSVDRLQLALLESTLCQPFSSNDQSVNDLALTYDIRHS